MNCIDQDMFLHLKNKEQTALRDSQLVSSALEGSSDAFAALQRLYSGHLYRTIFRITKCQEDAEDALQETFIRAHFALCQFEGRSSLNSWLTRIAINSALMALRRRRARPEVSLDAPKETGDDIPLFDIQDPALNPEQTYDQRQRCVNILLKVQMLDPCLRGPMQIRTKQGSSLKEIARALDISVAAAKTRLHRARVQLAERQLPKSVGTKRHVSSAVHRQGFIPCLPNGKQPCMNSD